MLKNKLLHFILLFVVCTPFIAVGQTLDTISVISYNILNYPSQGAGYSADTTSRHPHYRSILDDINPDILVVQEMNSYTGMTGFLSNVLNSSSNTYSMAPFVNGYDTDNGLFYKTDKFHSATNSIINTELRDINQFKLVHTLSGDTIRIFSVHLKSSSGSTNEAQRAREVDSLRKVTNLLAAGTNFIVCGDFNIYGSTESSYQKLLQVVGGNEGHVVDAITLTGNWNQFAYRSHHTQSPRVRAFGGGATGGMDDRFDMILYSKAISLTGGMAFVPNSIIAYGNDGNLYNDSINKPSNSAVSAAIANALHYASDHIPIKSKFTLEYNVGATPTDVGVTALLDPISPMCSNPNQAMSIRVKNFHVLPIDFSISNITLSIKVTTPSAGILTFTETLNTGILNAGAVMSVNFSSILDMSNAGIYSFKAYSSQASDINATNDTLSSVSITVTSSATASISPTGPIMMCVGDSVSLSASAGVSYLWSNNATTQNITVLDTGNYSVQVTLAGGCSSSSNIVSVSYNLPPSNNIVFYESMGTVTSTTAIATHETNNGFDNDILTMSGTGDVRVTSLSSGYSGASGGANIFFTGPGRIFTISGINTMGYSNIQLAHGMHKNGNASDGLDLVVEYSTDGINFTALSANPLNTGTGTSTWHFRNIIDTLPSVPALTLQFRHALNTTQFRIDDITLSGAFSTPYLSANGPSTFCQGDSVILTASTGSQYKWNNGATTQSITVYTSGSFFARVDCAPSDTIVVSVSNCQDVTLNLKAFIQGFYLGNQNMSAVVNPITLPNLCDTVTVELANSVSPYNTIYTIKSTLATNGTGDFVFPAAVLNNSFYIVIKHRNSLETWSSLPILFNNTNIVYDFTTNAGKAFGNNLANLDGEYCLFSGDISNGTLVGLQDGIIDSSDYDALENSLILFSTGYIVEDLTGDSLVESSDYSIIGTNVNQGIVAIRP